MHRRCIVHGDIKPDNILCFDADIFKICDFGLALRLRGIKAVEVGGLRGTYTFMAPEQFQGSLSCAVRSSVVASFSSFHSHHYNSLILHI